MALIISRQQLFTGGCCYGGDADNGSWDSPYSSDYNASYTGCRDRCRNWYANTKRLLRLDIGDRDSELQPMMLLLSPNNPSFIPNSGFP